MTEGKRGTARGKKKNGRESKRKRKTKCVAEKERNSKQQSKRIKGGEVRKELAVRGKN